MGTLQSFCVKPIPYIFVNVLNLYINQTFLLSSDHLYECDRSEIELESKASDGYLARQCDIAMWTANSTTAPGGFVGLVRNPATPATAIAFILGFPTAVLILVCLLHYFLKTWPNSRSDARSDAGDSCEPKILVIMPGEQTPTYLAKPLPNPTHQTQNA